MTDNDESRNWQRTIRQALKEPIDELRPGFARDVVERIKAGPDPSVWLSNRLLIATAATLAVAVLTVLALRPESAQQASAADQIRSLAREQRLLENELQDLQRLRQSAAPVVYLAGDENLEFVYALNDPRLAPEPGTVGNGYRTANR